MRTGLWMGHILIVVWVAGCGKAENRPVSEFEAPKPDSAKTTAMSPSDINELEESDFSPSREKSLTEKLEQSPNDTKLLVRLAKLTQTNAGSGEDLYRNSKRAAAYLHRAMTVDPDVVKSSTFREVAGEVFYNEGCAFARENQDEASIKSLVLAVRNGWTDLRHLNNDPQLERIRQSAGYANVKNAIHELNQSKARAAIEPVFALKRRFKFDFDLTDTDGQPLKKSSFEGKVLMVNIWGTWCPPCRAELPDLVATYEKFKGQGFEIVGLNSETETGKAADRLIKMAQEHEHITYRCALADSVTLDQIPNLQGLPTSLFFDRTGQLKGVTVGMIEGEKLELIIERLLKESADPAKEQSPTN